MANLNENTNMLQSILTAANELVDAIPLSQKGAGGGGVATLDEDGLVPVEQLPSHTHNSGDLQFLADYIIECGTSDGWNYEKWNSGKYILNRVYKETLTHYTTVGGFYGYVSSQISYPITFSELPVFYYNAKVANGFAISGGDVQVGLSSCRCYALSTASGEAACTFEIHVEGKWK